MNRWLSLFGLLVMFVAACPGTSAELSGSPDDGVDDPQGSNRACGDDSDCTVAARTCCDCPTFATSVGDPKLEACMDVMCPPPTQNQTCSKITAVCNAQHTCVVKCEAQPVTMSCASGFATDAAGCLIDMCAVPENECQVDTDCVRTRADCCGCTRGGSDTAVSRTALGTFDKGLGCTGQEFCPDVNTCEAGDTPMCAQGSCKLIAGPLPPNACGRPDLPACPTNTTCTVNVSDTASLHGVGTCQ